jgi:flagellar hook-basal body complex protein FliE
MNSLSAIEGINQSLAPIQTTPSAQQSNSPDFVSMLTTGIDKLDHNIAAAEQSMNAFALGEQLSTHELMIAMEKARFSMQVAVEIRNRLVEAYAELTRMQV